MDRRSLIAAALVAPAVLAAPALAAPSSEFERALAAYRKARADFEAPMPHDVPDELCIAMDDAFERMLRAPSRHAGDIAIKIDTLIFEYKNSIMDDGRLALIAMDAHRLAV